MRSLDAERDGSRFVSTSVAARMLGLTPGTLQNWRLYRRGPRYIKLGSGRSGRVLYDTRDLNEFLESSKVSHD